MNYFATPEFWFHYRRLPAEIRATADRCFQLLRADPRHPSLRFKKVGEFWSTRVNLRVRALARERPDGLVWFWIGGHDRYAELKAGAFPLLLAVATTAAERRNVNSRV